MPDDRADRRVLLLGGGGREHALALAIARSPRLHTLWISHPSNPGLASLGRPVDVPVKASESYRLVQFCDRERIDLVVVGPEHYLEDGLADALRTPNRLVFGPSREGARLETDKAFAKQFMRQASIPTAEAKVFERAEQALEFLDTRPEPPVIKAAGLAGGKGVVVPESLQEAKDAVHRIMTERAFGDAGSKIVIEERLSGPEVSVFALLDGRNILLLPTAQDHKRLKEGGAGPNTGGMGAFSPSPEIDERTMDRVERDVLVPLADSLRRDDLDYRGVLYVGLMLTHAGPKVLEFNVRFGDPECQVLLPRLTTDFLELAEATCTGRLHEIDVAFDPPASCGVVLASEGYPGRPITGHAITGIDQAESVPGVTVFHAGTAISDSGETVTAGGRVLTVVAVGQDLPEARRRAYDACERIHFPGMQRRDDIASVAACRS